jgi:hypothetical protein
VGFDVRHGIADGLEVLGVLVGNGDAEFLLATDDDLDHRERVDVEVVDEGLVQLDVLDRYTGDVVDELSELSADLFGGGHKGFSCRRGPLSGGFRKNLGVRAA